MVTRELANLRNEAAGRNGDFARADAAAPGSIQDFESFNQVVVVRLVGD